MKNKITKYLLSCLLMLSSLIFINIDNVKASGGLSISPGTTSVKSGQNVTFTVSASSDCFVAELNLSVDSGATVIKNLSKSSLDGLNGETATFTVKVTSNTTVTVTGISASYSTETENSAKASATISVVKDNNNSNPTNNNTTTQTPVKDTRSSENKLSSLSVSAGTLSPAFSESKTSYKVELTSETQTIEVSAKAKDSKATVSGTGKHDLKIGENNIVVTVKAENGSKKTYTISIYVTEKPSVFVNLNNQNLGVLNDYSKVDTPKGFEKATEKLNNQDVSVLKNENTGLTLIYLIDDSGQAGFYVFEDGKVLRKYETITILSKTYVILDVSKDIEKQDGLVRGKVAIGELELDGWTFEDKNHQNYSVVYLMNDAGEKNLYVYENTEGTLQKYVAYEQKNDNTLAYVFIGTTLLFAVTTGAVFVMHRNFKKRSIASIKEYYESKNQG